MQVIVFGMENCAGCTTVKNILKQKGVTFVERDVMNVDHMAEAKSYGVRGVPTVVRKFDVSFGYVTGSSEKSIKEIKEMLGVE